MAKKKTKIDTELEDDFNDVDEKKLSKIVQRSKKKPQSFGDILAEAELKRKAKVKKIRDAKREAES